MIKARKRLGVIFGLAAVFMLVLGSIAVAADAVTITGMVEDSDQGPMISAGGETYLLEGEIGDEFLGKQAKVTGTVGKDSDGTQYIVVGKHRSRRIKENGSVQDREPCLPLTARGTGALRPRGR